MLTPWLLHWYGPHWAFGVPGVLMALATLIFWMGRWRFIHIPAKGIGFLKETFSGAGIAAMGKLLIIYVFVAIFWALFDQTMTSWVLQADDMNRRWLGIEWLPSQVHLINPLFSLTFIPLFTYLIYPAINRVFPLTPIRKISIGLFIMVTGFAVVALAQEWIDAGQRPSIGWQVLAFALVTASEVMVSIVCLEFSYTQSPRSMKSWIMALFLFSVSLGNLFTAGVNHLIQVPNSLLVAEAMIPEGKEESTVILPGLDGEKGSADDISITFENGVRTGASFGGLSAVQPVVEEIEKYISENSWHVPSREEGDAMVEGAMDAWDQPLRYSLVNSRQCRVTSLGPDGEYMTEWDQGISVLVEIPEPEPKGWLALQIAKLRPETTWLTRRKQELGLEEESEPSAEGVEPEVSRKEFVGGQTRLEGAPYFWFFTRVMLGTAIAFMIVARFYKPKEYFHEEVGEEEEIAEAIQ